MDFSFPLASAGTLQILSFSALLSSFPSLLPLLLQQMRLATRADNDLMAEGTIAEGTAGQRDSGTGTGYVNKEKRWRGVWRSGVERRGCDSRLFSVSMDIHALRAR